MANKIGRLLQKAMDEAGLSQYRVAKETGLLPVNVCHVLGPRGNPQWMTIEKILKAIGYEIVLRRVCDDKNL